jgi:hypothetical protein
MLLRVARNLAKDNQNNNEAISVNASNSARTPCCILVVGHHLLVVSSALP